MKKATKKSDPNSLAGWAEIIRKEGEESRRKEEQRLLEAASVIASARTMECQPRLQKLLIAQRQGILKLNDLFAELYHLAGVDPTTLEIQ